MLQSIYKKGEQNTFICASLIINLLFYDVISPSLKSSVTKEGIIIFNICKKNNNKIPMLYPFPISAFRIATHHRSIMYHGRRIFPKYLFQDSLAFVIYA